LVAIRSPYRRKGPLWDRFRRYFGKPGRVLVVRASTPQLNPTIDKRLIAEDLEEDHEAASAEWLGEFRRDLANFVAREVVESLADRGVYERAPLPGQCYSAFCDPAGGAGLDGYTVAVGHKEGDTAILDAIREVRPPFSPSRVTEEFAGLLRYYGIGKVEGDRFPP
jgi:hypothetical protein